MPLWECNLQIYSAYTLKINALYVLLQEIFKGSSADTNYEQVLNQETAAEVQWTSWQLWLTNSPKQRWQSSAFLEKKLG